MAVSIVSVQCWSVPIEASGGIAASAPWNSKVSAGCQQAFFPVLARVHTKEAIQLDYLADQNAARKYTPAWSDHGSRKSFVELSGDFSSEGGDCIDSLTHLHKHLEQEPAMHSPLEKSDMKRLNEILNEKPKKGMLALREKFAKLGMSYNVDPEKLISGEYIVHKKVGIGQFVSLKEEVPEGGKSPQKYVYLRYADGMAKLPAKQARRLLYRYFRPGESVKRYPALSKLNDRSQWEKRRTEGSLDAQRRVVKMIDVYIRRLKQKRPVYSKDVPAMSKFAGKFPYTPTPDQIKAFLDVERDLTDAETPMDRLICGDVGFGKTEVAMRAIFYAVSAKKQVMVLAPTTVLAKQHHESIKERFANFPDIKVALLSRFQNNVDRRAVIAGINDGVVNIAVGTHSLLGNNIQYEKVGLLVVDEEQRFGVAQKEKISTLKTTVDILTLSATPIPRTLHMALSGFRDASLMTTPPPERRPIKTHVCVYSQDMVKDAIKAELDRQGQVFYVVPRIQDMESTEKKLKLLVPGVQVSIAHGKKCATELEATMTKFTEKGTSILLCTNIIESGLDIPTVNTIIVENVQMFGLAQIYQLRGRVGRADKVAHAYMLHPPKDFLSSDALERLSALEDCCALGQGFQLAERDMAIRGIGSIFGEKQSGEFSKVGVDLYAEMLFEAISKAQYHSLPQLEYEDVQLAMESNCQVCSLSSMQWEAVTDSAEEAAKKGIKDLVRFTENLRSERGKEPPPLEALLKTIYAKRMAADLGIHHIQTRGKQITMLTNMNADAFQVLHCSMASPPLKSSLSFSNGRLELHSLVELPSEFQLERLFQCLAELRRGLASFLTYR
ncbi:ATP-dependent DNA helicase At3g02060, chloroplastic [Selaginella moellendorffii]|uniref:ATP-dependent DNA helicase At3g02060, chloroplastic n=1 Tax=Selaginella moellendorffii TaxID=88036 RepID=UPI000D1CD73C|nr:ATP-dependent DNA helicase At3g02060, chloroplastic [Selaginella moellendorffii]|eukprot:XP_024539275.1 ATP-dependent DNA helicase At3g02060, chloroplastic [Selaginella moellendorffii]